MTKRRQACQALLGFSRDLRRRSMKKVRPVVARNARELAKVLGLSPADGMEIDLRSDLNDTIIEVVGKKGLTHSDVARIARTSRTLRDRHSESKHPRHPVLYCDSSLKRSLT